jgi:high-affinity nickel-transport protein
MESMLPGSRFFALPGSLSRAFDHAERLRLAGFFGAVALIHLIGCGALLTYGAGHPAFLGLGGLAYTFGLRHAFDADHISAIDNTTRKLLQEQRKPMGVGFFFSLGHSTVVLLIALLLGLVVKSLVQGAAGDGGGLKTIGGLVGTSVSGIFLILIGILNLMVLLFAIFRVRHVEERWGRMVEGGVLGAALHD